jgi:hypothetical protein
MSILDELRKKADEKKAAEKHAQLINERLEKIYQTELLPKMQLIFDTLSETLNHLNFLEEPIAVSNYSLRYPQFGHLLQGSYKINTDGRMGLADYNRLMEINLNFVCERKGDFSYFIEAAPLIEKEISFLQSKKLQFDWKYLAPKDGLASACFTVQRKVPVSFRIEVDYKHSQLNVIIKNHENLETFSKSFIPKQLDDNFLDMLLCYLLRQDRRLIKIGEISDEHKMAIKSAIQTKIEHFNKEQALLNGETDESNEQKTETAAKKSNPVKSIFSRFQKK